MKKPDLDCLYETFIKISDEDLREGTHFKKIRDMISPLISRLKEKNIINWYCFLIHDSMSGVPTTKDDHSLYFHIRVELNENIDPADFEKSLPSYCVMTRKASVSNVGIKKSLLKNEDDAEGWKILGEISEVIMNMVDIHREDISTDAYYRNVMQFLHFWFNITLFRIPATCPKCQTRFPADV